MVVAPEGKFSNDGGNMCISGTAGTAKDTSPPGSAPDPSIRPGPPVATGIDKGMQTSSDPRKKKQAMPERPSRRD